MRILVVGAGAVGGYFGGRLVEAGADVTFLVRPHRAQQLARDGLTVESPLGDIERPATTLVTGQAYDTPDIVILACKAYGLGGALDAISPYIGAPNIGSPNTGSGAAVLPLINGIAHLDLITSRFPGISVWGGVAHIGVTLTPDGVIKHLNTLHRLLFGPLDGADNNAAENNAAENLLAAFSRASVDAELRPAVRQDLWDKFVFLTTLAGSTCLMRASIGQILETAHGQAFILALLGECSAIAEAEGYAPDAGRIAGYRLQLMQPGSPSTASMLRDMERGSRTEAEHIVGDMMSRAQVHGIETPLLAIAYTHLQAYEVRLSARDGSQT